MADYWKKLTMLEKWNKQKRFNYILNYLHSKAEDASDDKDDDDVTAKTGSVAVHIIDSDNEPISGAIVTFSNKDNEYTCTTGKAGGCNMPTVIIGEYDTSVVAEDYIEDDDSFTVVEGENIFELTLEDENNEDPEGGEASIGEE